MRIPCQWHIVLTCSAWGRNRHTSKIPTDWRPLIIPWIVLVRLCKSYNWIGFPVQIIWLVVCDNLEPLVKFQYSSHKSRYRGARPLTGNDPRSLPIGGWWISLLTRQLMHSPFLTWPIIGRWRCVCWETLLRPVCWSVTSPLHVISSQVQNCLLCWHIEAETNGRHFADDIFKCIFLNENVWFAIEIPLKFVPKGSIDNIPALV